MKQNRKQIKASKAQNKTSKHLNKSKWFVKLHHYHNHHVKAISGCCSCSKMLIVFVWDWGCHNRGEGEGLRWNRKTGEINSGGKGTSWEEKGVVENGTHW